MTGQTWTVFWNEGSADTYLYGTELELRSRSETVFRNPLMPPGTVIKTWYSKTNFQSQRIEPALPIIDGETEYEISSNIQYPQGGRCFLRLVFFDKYEEEAGSLVVREKTLRFRCPLKTYSYQLQLMNAGTEMFCFHSITIREVTEDE